VFERIGSGIWIVNSDGGPADYLRIDRPPAWRPAAP
jgi:hypothetical protein